MEGGTALIILIATTSIGSAIAENILEQLGKVKEAKYCSVASASMAITTAIGCVLKAMAELRKL